MENLDEITKKLDKITEALFPGYREHEGEVKAQDRVQWALWQFLVAHPQAQEWRAAKQLAAHFEGRTDLSDAFARKEGESADDFETRIYRNLNVNQQSQINMDLLATQVSALAPLPRLACHAYIEASQRRMRLLVDPLKIRQVLERHAKNKNVPERKRALCQKALEELGPRVPEAELPLEEGRELSPELRRFLLDDQDRELQRIKKVYVPPSPLYAEARTQLEADNLVLISGLPHIGKTAMGLHLADTLNQSSSAQGILRFKWVPDEDKMRLLGDLESYIIFIDDIFGKSEFVSFLADRFSLIEDLKEKNWVILTTPKNPLERAFHETRLDEKTLSRSLIDLTPQRDQEIYSDPDLETIIRNHLAFFSEVEIKVSSREIEYALENRAEIIRSLRFPHEYERLVEIFLKEIRQERPLHEILTNARESERTARDWFVNLAPTERCFATCVLAFPEANEDFLFEAYQHLVALMNADGFALEVKSQPQLENRVSEYIDTRDNVSYRHSSYLNAVLQCYTQEFTREHPYLFSLVGEILLIHLEEREEEKRYWERSELGVGFSTALAVMFFLDSDRMLRVLYGFYYMLSIMLMEQYGFALALSALSSLRSMPDLGEKLTRAPELPTDSLLLPLVKAGGLRSGRALEIVHRMMGQGRVREKFFQLAWGFLLALATRTRMVGLGRVQGLENYGSEVLKIIRSLSWGEKVDVESLGNLMTWLEEGATRRQPVILRYLVADGLDEWLGWEVEPDRLILLCRLQDK